MILMGYSGAQGTLIYEKNLKSKISCQTPFKYTFKITCIYRYIMIENIFVHINACTIVHFCTMCVRIAHSVIAHTYI
jgi:hypothetical protein